MTELHERIKEIRKRSFLTQAQFAERLGISRTHISKIENGLDTPSDKLMDNICKEFWISISWLKHGKGSKQPGLEQLESWFGKSTLTNLEFEQANKLIGLRKQMANEIINAIFKTRIKFISDVDNFILTFTHIIAKFSKKIKQTGFDEIRLYPTGLKDEGNILLEEIFSFRDLAPDLYVRALKDILSELYGNPIRIHTET